MSTQSPAATLPPGTIAHILELALEGAEPLDQRATAFAFSGVCRSWAAEALRLPCFTVTTNQEAKALATKLKRHERTVTGRRTTRATTVAGPAVRARELTLVEDANGETEEYTALVRACPKVDSLELREMPNFDLLDVDPESFDFFVEDIFREVSNLRSLKIVGGLDQTLLLRALVELPTLEILDLSQCELIPDEEHDKFIPPPSFLPHLRHLGFHVDPAQDDPTVFDAIAGSNASLQSLLLRHEESCFSEILVSISDTFTTIAPNLVHLACRPDYFISSLASTSDDQSLVLALLHTTVKLETLPLSLPSFFAALRSLPHLVGRHFFIASDVDPADVATAVSDASFKHLEITTSPGYSCKRGEAGKIRAAAEAAGIVFRYGRD